MPPCDDLVLGAPAVAIPRSASRVLCGSDGQSYVLHLAWPSEPPPAVGYPVIYALDGNAVFGTMVETIRLRSRRADATGVVPAVVVGIGYEIDGPYDRERRARDYTPERAGGADVFRRFIEHDVKPAVQASLPIDPMRQTLFGHSLAGLFVLHTLLVTPRAFETYIAVSPSIWCDRSGLAAAIDDVESDAGQPLRDARVMLTVGEYEQVLAPWQSGDEAEDIARRRRERRMVDDARDLSVRLAGLVRHAAFDLFAGEDHASTVTVSISRSVRFCLDPRRVAASDAPR